MSLLRTSHQINLFKINPLKIKHLGIIRTMATAPAQKYEWMVIIPDHGGVLDKRMEVRPAHFKGLKTGFDSGFWKMGGAILQDVPKEGEGLKIEGSAMVAWAASKEEVIETLKRDIYAESGVWDFSKIQIYPFKCAFRIASDVTL